MAQTLRHRWPAFVVLSSLLAVGIGGRGLRGQELAPSPTPMQVTPCEPPVPLASPAPAPCDKPLPINLPTALHLAGTNPLDIAVASERIRLAVAQRQQAAVLWLPTLMTGVDYFRHDGRIQDSPGVVSDTSKSSLMLGTGPIAVFAVTDAIFGPLAIKQVIRSREADLQTARNDSLLQVAEAYFNVQQARGELAGAEDAARRAADLVRRTEQLAPGLAPPVEISRARTELARRRQAVHAAYERWRVFSADLVRVLRLDPTAVVEPLEPPHLQVTLVPKQPLDELIPLALTYRPELASQQAQVQAALQLVRQEKVRPLLPSVLLRGASTNPAGTLSTGVFGGGLNSELSNFGVRNDLDLQVLWELRNLGFGNRALVRQRKSEQQLATLQLLRIKDQVAADVAQAYAQALSAAARAEEAESGLRDALDSAEKNFEGLSQTKRLGNVLILVIRPQEAVAAVQALAQAYADYYGTVADYNRAQFRLYRALGNPAQALTGPAVDCPAGAAPSSSPGE